MPDDTLESTEIAKDTSPKYLEAINPQARLELIKVCARATEALPRAVCLGGAALRLTYETKTGKPMFGAGKGDYDFYVPAADIKKLDVVPPKGFQVNQEPGFHKPEEGYIVLDDVENNYAHIDLFGRGDGRASEEIMADGKKIRVLTVGEQVVDKAILYFRDWQKLSPKDQAKHSFYASKLLEITEFSDQKEINNAWERAKIKEGTDTEAKIALYKEQAKAQGKTLEALIREVLPQAANKPDAAPIIKNIAQSLAAVPMGDPGFEANLRDAYLEDRLKPYSSGWKQILSQAASAQT